MTVRVAVDAMGGDHAPANPVKGAVEAVRSLDVHVLLVGPADRVELELRRHAVSNLPISVVHAPEVVGMDEQATMAFRKRRSSIGVALALVRDGKADAAVSAGNTGAVLVGAQGILKKLPGVDRSALAAIVPSPYGPCVWLDVGANVQARPHHLRQWAVMGSLYAQAVLGIEHPRVGLLSVGEEEGKGTETTRRVLRMLRESRIHFLGNVEGGDLFTGKADVAISDGFVGNIGLKIAEGMGEVAAQLFREEIGRNPIRKLGGLLARGAFRDMRRRWDYSEYGGVPLLGVRGCVIICHGRSSPKAIRNAVKVASDFIGNRINEGIETQVRALAEVERRLEANGTMAEAADGST